MFKPTETNAPRPPETTERTTTRKAPLRLLVLAEELGVSISELEVKTAPEIAEMLKHFGPGGLDKAASRVIQKGLQQRGPERGSSPPPLNLPASQAELQYRVDQAYEFLYGRYAYHAYLGGPYDFMKEYAGFPLGIMWPYSPYELMLGQEGMATITVAGMGSNYCFENIYFNVGVYCFADRVYSGEQTDYSLCVCSYSGNVDGVDLYKNNGAGQSVLVLADLKNQQLPQNFDWTEYWCGACKAARYTVRHASQLATVCFDAKPDGGRAWWMWKLGNDYGFESDLYYPMFGIQYPFDRWCFDAAAYHDCGVIGQLPKKLGDSYKGFYYPYHSKVCAYRGSCGLPFSYVWLSQRDRLVRILQAIHMLIKYNNPDYSYLDPKDNGSYTTPRAVARDMEQNCSAGGPNVNNAYGINIYGQSADVASGVRTSAFLVLESLIGFKYLDATSWLWAERMADVMITVQWGSPPFSRNQGETQEYGVMTRAPYNGGHLLCWKPGSSYQFATPSKSFLHEALDWLGMPNEEEDFVPSNLESTATYLQALRVYLKYGFGVSYPTNERLP